MQKQLNILIISDIHESREYVDKLITNENMNEIDLILLLGDFLNLQHTIKDPEEIESKEKLIQLLSPLERWKCPIYLIPGNHDYDGLFNGTKLNDKIINIEGQFVQIGDNLQILALGGSTPGINLIELGYFKNGEQIWEGYPYQNEQQFSKKLDYFPKIEGQLILMTHIGPDISQTAISFEYGIDKEIQSGSKAISEFIIKNNVLLNVHGHTHDGVGSRLINQTQIVNVGPLLNGNYALISLKQNGNEWKISSIQHKIL